MMTNQGWIRLYRQLLDKPIWKKSTPEQKTILITLLLMANHEETEWEWNGEKFKVRPGQMVTSLDSIAKEAGKGISIQNVRTALKKFEKYGFLTNESTKTGRRITIVNWGLYQDNDKKLTKEETKNQQRPNKDLTSNKNDNNVINIEDEEDKGVPSPENTNEVPSSLSEPDKVPSHCQDPVLTFLNKVSNYYTTLTGRLASSSDEVSITDISKLTTNFELVKQAMDQSKKNFKPKYPGDKIRSFNFFVPAIKSRIAAEEARQKSAKNERREADGEYSKGNIDKRTLEIVRNSKKEWNIPEVNF